jgi:hypothetical protein
MVMRQLMLIVALLVLTMLVQPMCSQQQQVLQQPEHLLF